MAQVNLPAALQVAVEPTRSASGGFGDVVCGMHGPTQKRVAVKVQRVNMGKHEHQVLSQLNHPNIVGFVAHHIQGPTSYLVMEPASYEWLDEVCGKRTIGLPRGPAPLNQTRRRFADALAGVQYLHARHIAHLDLKLENMMVVAATDRLVIIDFGMAVIRPADTQSVWKGSPSYAAPGVFEESYNPYASDVWSLGACLFAACAGFMAFTKATACDRCFLKVQEAQKEKKSTTERIFEVYEKPVPFPQPLVRLLDEMLTINEKARATLNEVAASAWLLQAGGGGGGGGGALQAAEAPGDAAYRSCGSAVGMDAPPATVPQADMAALEGSDAVYQQASGPPAPPQARCTHARKRPNSSRGRRWPRLRRLPRRHSAPPPLPMSM